MRKLVRITSANRYKIFVTSDKGWLIGAFNQEKALVRAFSVIVKSSQPFV